MYRYNCLRIFLFAGLTCVYIDPRSILHYEGLNALPLIKQKIKEVGAMCSVGGGDFDLEIEKMEVERYKCNDCGNKFDAMGEKVVCPSCQSENVVKE
jgi:DNA-directed RNA polymerase subunit RPC12/RpoP